MFRMAKRRSAFILCVLIASLFLWGCPKKVVRIPPIEAPPVKDPIARFLEDFSPVESFRARASLRFDAVRKGEEIRYPVIQGVVLFERPDKLRILGYHPLGMGLFDALYRSGEFFLLIPIQNSAYTGEVSEFRDQIEQAGIRISTEKSEGSQIPNRIRIEVPDKQVRLDLRLREISINPLLPPESFQWIVSEGVNVRPLSQFLKGKKF